MPLQPPQAGLFDSKEELIDYCKQHAISERFVVTQDRGCDERKVYLKCDRGGTNDGQSIRSRIASIRRQGCPFRIYGACTKRDNYRWRLVVKNAEHNHEPAENFLAHPAARRFNAAQQERFQQMNANNATCETILNDLQLLNPAVELDISDVYSARKKARRERLDRRTPIQVLLAELDEHQYVSKYICDDDGYITHLFLAHPRAVQLTRAYHSVLLMDCTYKTNRFRMPLLNVVGVTNVHTTFTCCYVYLANEQEHSYVWALYCMRETFNVSPGVIVTDRELALMNAISTVFPDAANLLCIWHIDKNVLANTKDKFATAEEFDAFMKEWSAVCRSETPDVFEERWAALKEEYGADSQPVAYVESVWIRPHKERFVAAWTDQHLHLADMMRTKEIITLISPDKRSLVEAIDSEEDDAEFDERAHWSRRGLKKKVRVSSVNLR